MERPHPVLQQERIIVLDILRGIAILGILIVNMGMINSPYIYLELTKTELWTSLWDQAASSLIILFAQGKFYTMFSFLFGLGFIIFMERAEQKVQRTRNLFLRRMFILFLIGLIHAYFIWWGDILMMYAIGGLLLSGLYRAKSKTLLISAIILLGLYMVLIMLSVGMVSLTEKMQPGSFTAESQRLFASYQEEIDTSLYAYGQGSFTEIMAQRIKDLHFMFSNSIFTMFMIFPMFLLGAYAGKKKIFEHMQQHLRLIQKIWAGGLIVGLSLNILKYWSVQKIDPLFPSIYDILNVLGTAAGDPALCLFYIASTLLLTERLTWRERLAPFANVGRMAISNYLFQSLVCTTLYYSYGFGLYGQVGPGIGLALTFAIFGFQLYGSRLWLLKFHFGPVEWLWRSLTYGQRQAFKR